MVQVVNFLSFLITKALNALIYPELEQIFEKSLLEKAS